MPHAPVLTVRHAVALAGALLSLCTLGARAGSLDAPAAPTAAGSAMYTLESLYNRLDTGAEGSKRGSTFAEPAAAPGSTMHTLDQIMAELPALDATNGAAPGDVLSGKTYWGLTAAGWGPHTGTSAGGASAAVPQTGQTPTVPLNPAPTGSDGNLQKGVAWPNPRFTDNGNGTVTDNLSGLIWLKNANCFSTRNWTTALNDANTLSSGECGLTDGSAEGAWRLPNRRELESLVNLAYASPALSNATGTAKWTEGNAFSGVQSSNYWSSTLYADGTHFVWHMNLRDSFVSYDGKSNGYFVWPVRGGQ
jgi:hypothetical protein